VDIEPIPDANTDEKLPGEEMTRDDIIRMALEAGLGPFEMNCALAHVEDLERFFHMAQAAEREACAKVCDDIDVEYEGEDVLATWCAAAIRARGQA
jgi:hypothetical protein